MSVTDAGVLIERIDFADDSLASDIFHRNQLEFSVSTVLKIMEFLKG